MKGRGGGVLDLLVGFLVAHHPRGTCRQTMLPIQFFATYFKYVRGFSVQGSLWYFCLWLGPGSNRNTASSVFMGSEGTKGFWRKSM